MVSSCVLMASWPSFHLPCSLNLLCSWFKILLIFSLERVNLRVWGLLVAGGAASVPPLSPALGDVLRNHAPSCPSQQPGVQPHRRPGTVLELNVCFHAFYPSFGVLGRTGRGESQLTPCAGLPGGTRAPKRLHALSRGSKAHLWGWNDFINHSGFLCKCSSSYSLFSYTALSYFLFLIRFKLHMWYTLLGKVHINMCCASCFCVRPSET